MSDTNPSDIYTIFIISDGTGETAATMIRAAIVQYAQKEINIQRCKNIRSEEMTRIHLKKKLRWT